MKPSIQNQIKQMEQVLNQPIPTGTVEQTELDIAKESLENKVKEMSKSKTATPQNVLYPVRSMKDVDAVSTISASEYEQLDEEFVKTFSSEKMDSFVHTITPKMAIHILKNRMIKNRFVNVSSVKTFTDALREGRWQENGESLKVAKSLKLNDGQHRLMGCWNSQKPLKTVVAVGVEETTYTTIDQGKTRTLYDHLEMKIGIMAKMNLTKHIKGEEMRAKRAVDWASGFSKSMNNYGSIATNLQATEKVSGNTAIDTGDFLEQNVFNVPRHLDALNWFEKASHKLKLKYPALGQTTEGRSTQFARLVGCAVPIIQYRVLQPEKAEEFLNKLYLGTHIVSTEDGITQEPLPADNPVLRLRYRLQTDDGKFSGSPENIDNLCMTTQRAIHKHFAGESCKQMRGKVIKSRKGEDSQSRRSGVGIKFWSIPDHLESESVEIVQG